MKKSNVQIHKDIVKEVEYKEDVDLVTTASPTAWNVHVKILKLKKGIRKKFIELGAYLKQVHDFELYRRMGLSCETFDEYIAQPELTFQRSTAYSLIGVYEDFFEKESNHLDVENIEEIDYTKLDKIRRFKNLPKEEFEEWIEKARTLSLSDLNEEIRTAGGGTLADKDPRLNDVPNREDVGEYKEVTCPACGKVFAVKI